MGKGMNVNPLTEWQYRTNKAKVGAAWSAYLLSVFENGQGAEICPLSAKNCAPGQGAEICPLPAKNWASGQGAEICPLSTFSYNGTNLCPSPDFLLHFLSNFD
jgi:hypothetical protein